MLFMGATIVSCLYCIVFSQFNGDFFPQPIYASVGSLVITMIACLLPYYISWRFAGFFDAMRPQQVFNPSYKALLTLLITVSFAHIVVTILYGVGVMDREVYTAPLIVLPIIQILNRIDPFYLGAFFILATRKRFSTDVLAIALMVTIGFLRAGLGVFNYVVIAMCTKYSVELLATFRRMPWLTAAAAAGLPITISSLYEFRGWLRGDMQAELNLSEIILGRFIGRLSSFSNVAFIEQNSQSFAWASKMLEPLFYLKQAMVSLVGSGIAPVITPERLLIAGTQSYEGYSTFMAGVPGNLLMSWYVSPSVALLNLIIIIFCTCGILWMSRYFGSGKAGSFGMGMLFYPLTSGVANEFSTLLMNVALLLVFSVIFDRKLARGDTVYA